MSKSAKAAVELEEAFQRAVTIKGRKLPKQPDWEAALANFYSEAKAIRSRYSLGLIGRARAAYKLQQQLILKGYPPDVVRQVVFALVLNAFVAKK